MSRTKQPPTPDGVPLLGNGLAFSRDPFGAMAEWASQGGVVRLNFPGRSLYLVTGPDLIREVLVENQDSFTIGQQQRETFSGIEDDAVTANTGDRWERLRKGLHPAFTRERIGEYGPRMVDRTIDHVDRWEVGDEFDLLREMRLLTLRILGDTLLGVDIEGDEEVVLDAADALVERADPRRFGQLLPNWIPTPTQRRFEQRVSILDDYVDDVIAESSPGDEDVCGDLLAAHERDDAVVEDTDRAVYYSVYPTSDLIDPEWVDGNPVLSLSETIEYMQEYRWNFEPALEMVADEYDIDIDVDSPDYVPTQ